MPDIEDYFQKSLKEQVVFKMLNALLDQQLMLTKNDIIVETLLNPILSKAQVASIYKVSQIKNGAPTFR